MNWVLFISTREKFQDTPKCVGINFNRFGVNKDSKRFYIRFVVGLVVLWLDHVFPFSTNLINFKLQNATKIISINLFSHDVHSIRNTIIHHLNAKHGNKREDENELKPQNDLLVCTEQFLSVTNQMRREVCGRNDIHRAHRSRHAGRLHIVYFFSLCI